MLNVVLWTVQGFLALIFLAAGAPKLVGRGIERWTGFSDLPRSLVIVIGLAEVLGATALILPLATGTDAWLTPMAAIGLAIIVLMAAGFHLRADERLETIETSLWASILTMVAIGRWDLITPGVDAPASILITALAVLVPTVVVILAVLFSRPVASGDGSDVVGWRADR